MKTTFFSSVKALCFVLLSLWAGNANAQYCTPSYTFGCGFGDDINTFKLTGASSTSINDIGTGCSSAYYDDRTTAIPAVTLMQGGTYNGTISISGFFGTPFNVSGIQIYIDFNDNGTFTTAESVGGVNNIDVTATPYTITIPASATLGSHRMRVVLATDGDATYPGIDPCAATVIVAPLSFPYSYGETHDYLANITNTAATCPPITGLTMSAVTAASATLSWTAAAGALGYEWVVDMVSTDPSGAGTATTLTTANASGLAASTTYYAHVRTKCSATSFSTWVTTTFTTLPAGTPTCPPVTGLAMSAITSAAATLSWTAATGAVGYEWAVTTSATPPASGTATTATTANATGLSAATAYYAHVRTKCSATSFSTWVTTNFTTTTTTTPPTCAPVTGLTASSITITSALVSWTAVAGSLGYQYVINTTAADPIGSGANTLATNTTASGLTGGTTYYAHVRDSCGPGNYSVWVTIPFTTIAPGCNPVTGLTASSITASSANVGWIAVTGSAGYQYVIDNTVATPPGAGTPIAATTYAASGLTAATTYYAHVRNSCSSTSFSAWNTIPFTTLSTTCNAVTSLTASAITSHSATVSWLSASGTLAAQYVIDNNPADPTTSGTTTGVSSINVTGLMSATTYYAHVRDSCGATALSAWVTIPLTTLGSGVGVIDVNAAGSFRINAYPNPVSEQLTVEIEGNPTGAAQLQLMDVTGKLIQTTSVQNSNTNINMNGLAPGLYLIRYIDAEHMQTIKVNKQ